MIAKKIEYRPEIDGLRTIAVMLVILHHLELGALPGGYVGVDVFFVISGYLITSIIYYEINSKRFSVVEFYKRRITRLGPAYFLVISATSIATFIYMLPAEMLNYGESVIYSTFFMANFYMWNEVGGYFGAQSEVVPLLHLWSLAVEEQFYIFWPVALLLTQRLFGVRAVFMLVAVGILSGIFISEWGVNNYRAAAYYLLPTRFFELLVGAFVALLPSINKKSVTTEIFSIVGALFIVYSAFFFSKGQFFPGVSALVPTLGAALIIYFLNDSGILGRILSNCVMVYIGKISYPAYLWHWPIIAFLNLNLVTIDLYTGFCVLVVTFFLSSITYHYVETPFRRAVSHSYKRVFGAGFVLPSVAAALLVFSIFGSAGFPGRFDVSINKKSEALQSYSNKIRGRCNEGSIDNPLSEDLCVLGEAGGEVDFLLIGDSHANHFTGMIDVLAKGAGVRGYDITQSNTIYLPDVKRYYDVDGEKVEHRNFELRNKVWSEIIGSERYRAVVLGGSFAAYYNEGEFFLDGASNSTDAFELGFRKAVQSIIKAGSKVFIIKGTPVLSGVDYDCSIKNERFELNEYCDLSKDVHDKHFNKWSAFLLRIKDEFPEVSFIEPDKVICGELSCKTEIDGIPLYRDDNHLNHLGSEFIGSEYIKRYGNPFSILKES
ncbi:acyltransferase family protein [Zobellella maritima]|uniref:acyltransferase family protein n=1 Tax=Zobellella maritima TaxID=2059725 RepID=UPI000E302EF3|nr:acyltransferase family protein [Zobellella maritima]